MCYLEEKVQRLEMEHLLKMWDLEEKIKKLEERLKKLEEVE